MLITHKITTCELTRRYTAVVRGEMPIDELPAWLAAVFPVVTGYLRQVHVPRTGPPFARYTFIGEQVAVEAGFPVTREVDGDGLVEASALPGGCAAGTTHFGPYDELTRAHQTVLAWIRDHGLRPAGPHWEVYRTDPLTHPDPAQWCTEVVVPYERG